MALEYSMLKCLFLLSYLVKNSVTLVELFDVDLDDILNTNFMPTALFLQQDIRVDANTSIPELHDKADFNKAYEMMGYHRKMMNEYQCNNFIVKQIMLEIEGPNTTIARRLGSPAEENAPQKNKTSSRKAKMIPNEELLYDPGSSGYTNWLAKTTTLDDIYKQLGNNVASSANSTFGVSDQNRRTPGANRRQSYNAGDLQDDDYEEGDITGYAVQQPMPGQNNLDLKAYGLDYVPTKTGVAEIPLPVPYPTAGSKNGYFPTGHEENDDSYRVHMYGPPGGQPSKELGLKDVMEIAMTTLAFLSFGMFILQVLMCITMDKSNNRMMMPMEAADGNGSEVEEIRRKKRSIENEQLLRINEISRRILLSMDAVTYTNEDDGHCLFRLLCENNRFAREQKDRQKMWIPVWGLGLSWLSSRMARPNTSTNMRLASLKASIFGLGGANCDQIYSSCNFKKMSENKWKESAEFNEENEKYKFRWSL